MNNEQRDIIGQITDGNWWFVTPKALDAIRQLRLDHEHAEKDMELTEAVCMEFDSQRRSSEAHILSLQLAIDEERQAADLIREKLHKALTKVNELEEAFEVIAPCSDALVQERDQLEQENESLKEMVRTLELQLYAGGSLAQENEDLKRQLQHANFLNTSARHILEDGEGCGNG